MEKAAEKLHRESIVIDATCPLATLSEYLDTWIEGGATVIAPTVCYPGELLHTTVKRVGGWLKTLSDNPDKLLHIKSVENIYQAKKENKLGLIFHFQGSLPFEKDLNNIEVFYHLGIRMVQLCYNTRDLVGDGCAERTDTGLSEYGLKVIAELDRLGIVVDCSHTGCKTTMEAIEASSKPVIISHGNARAVCDSFRNLGDDQIKAIAKNGGVIGLNGYPAFVAKKDKPTVDDLIDHADYIANLVGVEHVSVGIDYYEGMAGVASDIEAKAMYNGWVASGAWDPRDYPPPPWHYPQGIEMPDKLPNLTKALLRRGYSQKDVKNILGLNLIRVFNEVWI
jgi:membrane dipeptidase